MRSKRLRFLGMAMLAGMAAGCATRPTATLPDPSVVAMQEWDHGPPWGPEEIPWVAPPTSYALLGPGYPTYGSPYYWGPTSGAGVGLGLGRGYWWRGSHRFYGGGFGHRGFGGPRHFGGGHFGGGHFGGRHGRR